MASVLVTPKSPLLSKINWVQAVSFAIQLLTLILNSDWVKDNPQATLLIGMAVNALTAALRTYLPTAPTTLAMKAVVIFALSFAALGASPLEAAPTRCFRGADGIVRCEGATGQRVGVIGIFKRILRR